MARALIIRNADKRVLNAIEYDESATWTKPIGTTLLETDRGNPGDTWDGGVDFTSPAPILPDPQIATDIQTLRDFQVNATPTAADIVKAVRAQTRLLRRIVQELAP